MSSNVKLRHIIELYRAVKKQRGGGGELPYYPPQDVASNSGSLVQVAEQAHPLVQRCPSPNPMREHRNNRTHEEVVVGGGATPHG